MKYVIWIENKKYKKEDKGFKKGDQHIEGPWAMEERNVKIEKLGTGIHFQYTSHKYEHSTRTTFTQH